MKFMDYRWNHGPIGYNPISMFGRSAAGAIDKRRAGIMKALEKR